MLLLPMLLIGFYSLIKQGNGIVPFTVTLEYYRKFFTDKDFLLVLFRSVVIAIKTTIICLLIGYPVAFFISRCTEKVQNVLILCITLPTWINMLVRTYAWIGILTKGGLISTILSFFGFKDVELLYTETAVLIGMVYNFLPFMILQIHTSLTKMDQNLIVAANDLGANKWQAFLKVTLPLSLPGVISGITLVFLPAVSSFFIPKLLGGGDFVLIGNLIENYFISTGDWNFGSAISLIMAIIILISMYITKKLDHEKETN